jgi:hypothetical protein
MIPGQNLLNMAFRIIAQQSVIYYHYLGRTQNSVGQDIAQYSAGRVISGSFQPVPRVLYQNLGLDFQKDYWTFYVSYNVNDVGRSVAGDQIAFNGQRYQCESNNDWYYVDGWKGSLFVHIGIDSADSNVFGFNNKPITNTNQNFDSGNFLGGNE